ncbi:MAG: triose-phosphate isomerase [Candidatus Tectomicrobia bacterium]|nr:triose-phosphate isomerase [Candidatus Tectomicrobia bacterium]
MRQALIAGNWKENKTNQEARELVSALLPLVSDVNDVGIIVAPPFTALSAVFDLIRGSNIALAAQSLFWEEKGAYTGEISPLMLKDVGCQFVIIGHSERRQYFGETNETVNKKIFAALKHELTPIICFGETLQDREAQRTFDVVGTQFDEGLKNLTGDDMKKAVIAYEPLWAIGTGRTATPDQADEVHRFMRGKLREKFGEGIASEIRIQYGGSVNPSNIADLMAKPDIDGALVGGASLEAESFARIVKFRK